MLAEKWSVTDYVRYRFLDLGLSLVPRLTIFLTHSTVMLDSHSGATQITFEWQLPHLSRNRNASV
jgi:hypothetical protein